MRHKRPLTQRQIEQITEPGTYAVGPLCLYLKISPGGGRSWVCRYADGTGRRHNMGLGPVAQVSLAEARDQVIDALRERRVGIDPLAKKREARAAVLAAMPFWEVADQYLQKMAPGWKGPQAAHDRRLEATKYIKPWLGVVPIDRIDTAAVLRAIEPIWKATPTTGMRVRGKIASVLDFATAAGYRKGENPARWKGHLENLLAAPQKIAAVEHRAALRPEQVAPFIVDVRQDERVVGRLLEFIVLTACRSDEARLATWSEIEGDLWTIPASRTKTRLEHMVPLSPRAQEILAEMRRGRTSDFIFPGHQPGRPLGHAAALELAQRIEPDITLHGFRASFRTWGGDISHHPADVVGRCLGHAIGNKVDQAYHRGAELAKRRAVMESWAAFVDRPVVGDVVPLRRST